MRHGWVWLGGSRIRFVLLLCAVHLLLACTFSLSLAQEVLHVAPGERIQELPQPFPEEPPLVPPVIQQPTPPFAPGEGGEIPPRGPRFLAREIRVSGSTVFSSKKIAEITAPYLNRELSSADLEALRRALTLLYINNGYINSGAVVPDDEAPLHRVAAKGHCWIARHRPEVDPDQVRPEYLRLPDAEIARRGKGK